MRRRLVLLSIVACNAQAQPQAQSEAQIHVQPPAPTQWFTVTGNPADASMDTVQVDPVATHVEGQFRTMNVRVSRARQRFNWENVPYRSYESKVVFDCRARKAGYTFATFYPQPLWQGAPSKSTDYSRNPQPMLFRDVEPNPMQRIIRAACQSGG
ncbi:surface-adhesin E family protein [Variovorax sp. YR216]|uniref:surface-adhesin E family protein n=1 Tax=Variovorax sp. YR216 TaxID=1882828 RepID=UPI0008987208|nr:surface-adhesin E family protein [Variovorax sp. YR216]SEB24197.1 hypothetical protein SAMN05444680_119113 [Variovorax sp. YR216]